METIRFIHCADIHLDSKLRGLEKYEGAPVEELRGATRVALQSLVDFAIESKVSLVLISGDVYDGDWRDFNTGLYFSRMMGILRDAGIRVVIVAGNHDADSQISKSIRYPDNVHVLRTDEPTTLPFDDLGIAVHGQGFRTRDVFEDLSLAYPKATPGMTNIGMLHTCAEGRDGHDRYAPCDPRALAQRGYDYWALGHVHTREDVLRMPEHPCWAIFPGNIQGRHIRERGPKGFTWVEIKGGTLGTPVHRSCDVVRWSNCTVDASGASDSEDVLRLIELTLREASRSAEGRLVAARVTVSGRARARNGIERDREAFISEVRNIANQIGGSGVWVEKVILNLRGAEDAQQLRLREEPIGDLLRALDSIPETVLASLSDDLRPLVPKLPIEAATELGIIDLSPAALTKLLERLTPEIEELLISKAVT